ncbi:MAG: hypothetical protein V4538_14945 [Bacteroidota bacterium]
MLLEKSNRCQYELIVEKYFGISISNTPIKIAVDDHMLVDLVCATHQHFNTSTTAAEMAVGQTAIKTMMDKIKAIKGDTIDKGNLLHWLSYYIEVEKQQIINAYTVGNGRGAYPITLGENPFPDLVTFIASTTAAESTGEVGKVWQVKEMPEVLNLDVIINTYVHAYGTDVLHEIQSHFWTAIDAIQKKLNN